MANFLLTSRARPHHRPCRLKVRVPIGFPLRRKDMATRYRLPLLLLIATLLGSSLFSQTHAQEKKRPSSPEPTKNLTLVKAAMCEGIKDLVPRNEAIVFSMRTGKVYSFTSFDPVPEKTFIYHNWFFRDRPRRRVKLSLRTPRWATFSRIKLRKGDKGPWRVEITDKQGNILRTLRFSITD